MSGIVRKPKLLIIDTSPSMAQALSTYARQQQQQAEVYCDPSEACEALDKSLESPDFYYDCVVLGWPRGKISIIADLLAKLSISDHVGLPLVVVSEGGSAVIDALVKRRSNTQALLWKNYRQLSELTDNLVARAPVNRTIPSPAVARHILMVSNKLSESAPLTSLLKENGYQVTLSNNIVLAKAALQNNQFDLVVSDYYLHGESAEQLSEHIKQMTTRPVYAFMTGKNLDEVVQSSLALGAITCLDKTSPTENLFVRLDAIVGGMPARTVPEISGLAENSLLVPLEGLLEMSVDPALILDSKQQIVASNQKAADALAAGDQAKLLERNFAETVLSGELNLAYTNRVVSEFMTVTGTQFNAGYRLKKLSDSSLGIKDAHYLITFKVLAEIPDTALVGVAPKQKITPAMAAVTEDGILTASGITRAIDQAFISRKAGQVISLLMLDIKMDATVTGDRLSLGDSEPLLALVKEQLLSNVLKENTLAYLGRGRFVYLLEVEQLEEALVLSEKLVKAVPGLLDNLNDVELLSHTAFLRIPEQSSMSADLLLRHCVAACLKTEMDGRDNAVYVIGKELWQQPEAATAGVQKTRSVAPVASSVDTRQAEIH